MSPPVTWLMPVRNGMPFLPETLASIEAQTYRNWKVLAWDNGSTDGSAEELTRWIPDRLPGRLVVGDPRPLGPCLAEMVRQADTEYLARIDADDINLPARLERQVQFMESHAELGLLSAHYELIDTAGEKTGTRASMPLDHGDIVYRMLWQNAFAHPAALFKRSVILEAGNYGDFKSVEDYDLWFRVLRVAKVANLEEILLLYRVHDRSVTQSAIADESLDQRIEDCKARNEPSIYGISEEDARLLHRRAHPDTFAILDQIARFLQIEGGTKNPWKSPWFVESASALIPPGDKLSWARMLATSGQYGELARGIGRQFRRKS